MDKRARSAPFARKRPRKASQSRRTKTSIIAGCALLLVATVAHDHAHAQDINEAVTMEDLGFTLRLSTGARAAAMAGAYTAVGDDAQCLVYNPAGLARLRRIELAVGFQYQRTNLKSKFYGGPGETEATSFTLDHASWAYPVPTYRGSFVLALGVNRVYTSEIDILNRGFNTSTQTDDDYRLQQSGSAYAYNFGFGIDLAPVLSAGVNGFFMDGTIDALTQFTFSYPPPFVNGQTTDYTLVDDAEVDLNGWGGMVGILYNPLPALDFGVSVSTPTAVRLRGDAIQQTAEYFYNAPDSSATESFVIQTDQTIPFRVNGGVSFHTNGFLVAADVGYADWTQAKINGYQLKDSNLKPVFRDVVDFRAGAEVVIPKTTLKVRGGYAYLPYALPRLQADRISGDAIQRASIKTERHMITGGMGILLARALNLDAALQYTTGERAIPTLTDKRDAWRLVMSGSYRW